MSGRILITDAEERAALAACRGLSAAGYRVTAAACRRPAPTHWSRTCAERVGLPDPRAGTLTFAAGLEERLSRGDYAALIAGSDASLLAISEHRARLEPLTRLGLPPPEAVQRSVDKVLLLQAAASAGLAAPPSRSCAERSEAAAAAAELGYPVVVKPARSFLRSGDGLRQQRVTVADDQPALEEAVRSYTPPFIVQRFEQARFVSSTGVIADGRLLALTTSRVSRLWPPTVGMHTFSETIAPSPRLADDIRALLGELGWEGIFQLQMFERSDGRLSVIDLNPRLFASMTLDQSAGANLAAIWCDWLLGGRPKPVMARAGYRYRWEEGELCHLAWQVRRARFRAAAAVLVPHRRVAHAWFRVGDPAPLLARALQLGVRAVEKRIRGAPPARKRPPVPAVLNQPASRGR
jgi:predicted ATP-grasp superfamily ATP-dependent carboligase